MDDIPDPTDWLHTPLSLFSDLENSLHCQICKEFYDTPMITSCNHTFCSRCIRTNLSQDGTCPACRSKDQASKLRNNWALEDVVSRFMTARPAALAVARRQKEEEERVSNDARRPGKRKRAVLDTDIVETEGRTTRSKTRRVTASQSSQQEPIEIADTDEDYHPDPDPPQPDDGLVECPLGCGKRMKEEQVFGHLDQCEDETKNQREQETNRSRHFSQSERSSTPTQRISELNYGMMNQAALAKKLRDLDLPAWGPKQLMQRRHTEWVNLWNANCDSNQPHTRRELLRELDAWERTQGGKAPQANTGGNSVMRKNFDGTTWANKNKDQFSKLIADARRKKTAPAEDQLDIVQEHAKTEGFQGESGGVSDAPTQPDSEPDLAIRDTDQGQEHEMPKPYENNEDAILSVREKVEAANSGSPIRPQNAEFRDDEGEKALQPSSHTHNNRQPLPKPGAGNTALLGQSHFGHDVRPQSESRQETDQPQQSSSFGEDSLVKKVPMFRVPQHPVSDLDGGGLGQ